MEKWIAIGENGNVPKNRQFSAGAMVLASRLTALHEMNTRVILLTPSPSLGDYLKTFFRPDY